jgi:CBS domain-containing protein
VAETAADLMTSPAVTISADATVAEAARLTAKARVHRLPVVDGMGELLGIVSRSDLLKFYLRDDDSTRTQIIDGIVVGQMAIDPLALTVTVEEGIVGLSGKLERRLLVQDLLDEVRAIDGVVAVHSTVGYDVDDTPMPYRALY